MLTICISSEQTFVIVKHKIMGHPTILQKLLTPRPHLIPPSAKRVVGFGNKHVEGFCDHDYARKNRYYIVKKTGSHKQSELSG
jgi:hypothetical protein